MKKKTLLRKLYDTGSRLETRAERAVAGLVRRLTRRGKK